jgi:CheY-like chemotaxis protein
MRKTILSGRGGAKPHSVSPFSILIVDPDPDTRELYRLCFELAGCAVVEASDGRDALAKALGRTPSLIVAETQLPFIDGFALCELLRRDPATSRMPILFVTAESRAAELAQAVHLGANGVLVKPAAPDDVLQAAMALLKSSPPADGATASARQSVAPVEERLARSMRSARPFDTLNPPSRPPELICPACDRSLTYDHSHVGGVGDARNEQWDYYNCTACGAFQYRQRTRTLRRVS